MDSRIFYTVFRHALQFVAWDLHGKNEYVLVGDGIEIDHARLQSFVEQTFPGPVVSYPKSRKETLEVPLPGAAKFLAEQLPANGAVTVSDPDARVFLQVHSIGIARSGWSQANSSFKPKPLRGSA